MSPLTELIGGAKAYGWGAFALSTSFESIATVTVGSSAVNEIEFTGIPATYTHLQVRGIFRANTNSFNARLKINGDTGTNYAWHNIASDGSAVSVDKGATQSRIVLGATFSTTSVFCTFVMDILDYANTNKYKTTRTLWGINRNQSGQQDNGLWSGLWQNTNAITSLTFEDETTEQFAQYSHIALYGIKVPT